MRRFKGQMLVSLLVAGGVFLCSSSILKAESANESKNEPGVYAKIVKLTGKVQYKSPSDKTWKDAKVNDILKEGWEIRTGLRSAVLVKFQDTVVIHIRSATRIAITELSKEENKEHTRVLINYGTVRAGVLPKNIQSDFQIVCPTAVLSREGTWGIEFSYDPATGRYVAGLDTEGLIRVVNTLTQREMRLHPKQYVRQTLNLGDIPRITKLKATAIRSAIFAEAVERWSNIATFRRTVSLTDRFGTTRVERLLYANNRGGGRLGINPTGGERIVKPPRCHRFFTHKYMTIGEK